MPSKKAYSRKVFEGKSSHTLLIFGCPFGTKIGLFGKLIRKLNKDGYIVIAYDFNNDVFYKGDAALLPKLTKAVIEDMSEMISTYKEKGVTNIGFFGTSLGAFELYVAMTKIPGFNWGVINTGGDIAAGIWKFSRAKRAFEKNGYTLQKLQREWHNMQRPKFETNLEKSQFIFIGSNYDPITPLSKLREFADYIHDETGAKVEVIKVRGLGHNHTALIGLTKYRRLIKKLNP